MADCPYCDESFSGEQRMLKHVASEHPDEMGEIERRRLEDPDDSSLIRNPEVIAGVAFSLVIVAVFAYSIFFADVTQVVEPSERGTVEEYGTISIEVDGEAIDLTQEDYLEADVHWFLHPDTVEEAESVYVWEKHSRDVTLEYALLSLGVDVGTSTDNATFVDITLAEAEREPITYSEAAGDTVEITVNDEDVQPRERRLHGAASPGEAEEGDHVHVKLEAAE